MFNCHDWFADGTFNEDFEFPASITRLQINLPVWWLLDCWLPSNEHRPQNGGWTNHFPDMGYSQWSSSGVECFEEDGISSLVDGWPTPLKNMSSSVGMMKFPIYGKMFQTTNQILYQYIIILKTWWSTSSPIRMVLVSHVSQTVSGLSEAHLSRGHGHTSLMSDGAASQSKSLGPMGVAGLIWPWR